MLEKKLRKILLPLSAKSVSAPSKDRLKKFIASQDKVMQQEAASLGINFQKINFSGRQDVVTFRPNSDTPLPCVREDNKKRKIRSSGEEDTDSTSAPNKHKRSRR